MKKVMMLIANGVEPLEMSAFSDVLGWAAMVGDETIELIDVGMQSQIKTNLKPFKPTTNKNLVSNYFHYYQKELLVFIHPFWFKFTILM